MKKTCSTFILFVFLGSFILSGCAFKDIDKRLFVSAIGIDPSEKIDGGYKVTIKAALPFGAIKESTQPSFAYMSEDAISIGEAIRLLESHVDKVLEFGHAKVIVVHEELLTDGIKKFMDYVTRRGDIQMISYVAAASPSAETILKLEPATEAPASVALFNFFGDTGTESPFVTTTYLFEFRRNFLAQGIHAVLPLIEVNEEENEYIINKSVVISKDKKALELNAKETKFFNLLINHKVGFAYPVPSDDLRLLLNIERVKMNFKIIKKEGKPDAIKVDVGISGIIGESNKPLSLKKLDKYNKISEKVIKETISDLLHKLQKENLDPFGFGLRYRATTLYNKDVFPDWEAAYPDLDIQLKVSVQIQSTGNIE